MKRTIQHQLWRSLAPSFQEHWEMRKSVIAFHQTQNMVRDFRWRL